MNQFKIKYCDTTVHIYIGTRLLNFDEWIVEYMAHYSGLSDSDVRILNSALKALNSSQLKDVGPKEQLELLLSI